MTTRYELAFEIRPARAGALECWRAFARAAAAFGGFAPEALLGILDDLVGQLLVPRTPRRDVVGHLLDLVAERAWDRHVTEGRMSGPGPALVEPVPSLDEWYLPQWEVMSGALGYGVGRSAAWLVWSPPNAHRNFAEWQVWVTGPPDAARSILDRATAARPDWPSWHVVEDLLTLEDHPDGDPRRMALAKLKQRLKYGTSTEEARAAIEEALATSPGASAAAVERLVPPMLRRPLPEPAVLDDEEGEE